MMESHVAQENGTSSGPLYVRVADRIRFDRLARLESRKPVDQFKVLVDEAFRLRGLAQEPSDIASPSESPTTG